MPITQEELARFPVAPGVYIMQDKGGKVLYVGKAKNLRQRVRQYFVPGRDGRVIVPFLAAQVDSIETLIVSSEKEALLLENNLIKKHQPKYNALLKDDKTYCSLTINHKHPWPMIRLVRFKGKPPKDSLYFGPYTNGYAARQTLDLLRQLFPMRQCSDHELANRSRPCILYDLKKCIAPCVNKCTHAEYDQLVKRAISFLRGHDAEILRELKVERALAIEALAFERAEQIHRTITAIEETLEKQAVQKAGQEDLDVLGLYREGEAATITVLFFREGKLIGRSDHHFAHNAEADSDLLSSFILQNYTEKELLPPGLLTPLPIPESTTLSELIGIEITAPQRGNKRALVEMASKNALQQFQQASRLQNLAEKVLMEMEETFALTNYPERVECFDISTLGGTEGVGAMVVFSHGEKDPQRYRKYKIKKAAPGDDYGALEEVLERRYAHAKEEGNLPDCILIDGGKGHLNTALKVLKKLDISTVDLLSIAKESGKHTKGMTAERVFLIGREEPIEFASTSSLLFFLQKVRDETHRFAISFQRQRRTARTLHSILDTIPGIGPAKKKRLLTHFGSLKKIREATRSELEAVPGLSTTDIDNILSALAEG